MGIEKVKRLAVSVDVHKFIMFRVLEFEEFKCVDDYLRKKLNI